MERNKFLSAVILLFLVGLHVSAQQVFRGPVDYDYDNMQQVVLSGTDAGGEFAFTPQVVDDGDRTLYVPTCQDLPLHQRELYLFAHQGKIFLGANVVREDEKLRVDTMAVIGFNIKRMPMTVSTCANGYDGNWEMELAMEPADTTQSSTLLLSNKEGEQVALTLDYQANRLKLQQSDILVEAPLLQAVDPNNSEQWRLRIFVSRKTIEVFVNEGRQVMSHSIQVQYPLVNMTMKSHGGRTKYTNIYFYKRA